MGRPRLHHTPEQHKAAKQLRNAQHYQKYGLLSTILIVLIRLETNQLYWPGERHWLLHGESVQRLWLWVAHSSMLHLRSPCSDRRSVRQANLALTSQEGRCD